TRSGCSCSSPPGVPGGGMTLSCPPPGGVTCISRSTPAGGHMTPFDWASLSLNGSELPPPTVGGSPLTSGGHVAPLSGGGFVVGCASAKFVAATVTNNVMMGTNQRNGQVLGDLQRMRNQRADVPERSALSAGQGARTGRKAIAATWKVARVIAIEPE